jgi:hypothetical protein
LSHLINHICANQKVGTQYVDVALCVVKAGSTMRARWPDKFRLAYPRNKTNPQRYQFSEEPQIYLRCSTLYVHDFNDKLYFNLFQAFYMLFKNEFMN